MNVKERAEAIVAQLERDCGEHDHRHRQNLYWVEVMIQAAVDDGLREYQSDAAADDALIVKRQESGGRWL